MQTLSAALHDRLRADLLSGRWAPGEALPSERALREELGVNRHAIREALKRLQQAGLVDISQGGATRVRDWRSSGGLDLLAALPGAAGEALRGEVVAAAMEMRLCIGADAARRCAQRMPEPFAEELEALDRAVEVADDPLDAYRRLWDAIVDGSRNVAYRLAYNSLLAGEEALGEAAAGVVDTEIADREGRRRLVQALAARDADAAERAARDLLEPTAAHAAAALEA